MPTIASEHVAATIDSGIATILSLYSLSLHINISLQEQHSQKIFGGFLAYSGCGELTV